MGVSEVLSAWIRQLVYGCLDEKSYTALCCVLELAVSNKCAFVQFSIVKPQSGACISILWTNTSSQCVCKLSLPTSGPLNLSDLLCSWPTGFKFTGYLWLMGVVSGHCFAIEQMMLCLAINIHLKDVTSLSLVTIWQKSKDLKWGHL